MTTEVAPGLREPFSNETLLLAKRIGIVLAGGRSRRMGTNKALLRLNGETLLERAVRILKEAGGAETAVLVSGKIPGVDANFIEDEIPGVGPLGGIASVIAFLERTLGADVLGRECLVLSVDMPGVSTSALSNLASHLAKGDGAFFDAEPLPLAFRVTPAVLDFFGKRMPGLSAQEKSLQEFERAIGARSFIHTGKDATFSNVNTPADWEEFRK